MFEAVIMICSALMSALGITAVLFALMESQAIPLIATDTFGLICYFSWLPGLAASMISLSMTSSTRKAETIQ
jgi:pseudouridine-5'-phosphate glycosidase